MKSFKFTDLEDKKIVCAICSTVSTHSYIKYTMLSDAPDLDLRPPEFKRSTMHIWIQKCPSCGYCLSDIGEAYSISNTLIDSKIYQQQLRNQSYPVLANSFLCDAIIQKQTGHYAKALYSYLSAAWSCDDNQLNDQAIECRKMAIEGLTIIIDNDLALPQNDYEFLLNQFDGTIKTSLKVEQLKRYPSKADYVSIFTEGNYLLLVDLHRRIKKFEDAIVLAEKYVENITNSITKRLIGFECILADSEVDECRTVNDALIWHKIE